MNANDELLNDVITIEDSDVEPMTKTNADSVQAPTFEKLSDHCKLCRIVIQGNFDDHLFDSHYKKKIHDLIPSQVRGCSGKKALKSSH